MNILIAKQNEMIIRKFFPYTQFSESTKNTSYFRISARRYAELINHVKTIGINPFALLTVIN